MPPDPTIFLQFGALGLLGFFVYIVLTNLTSEIRRTREAIQELTILIRELKLIIERNKCECKSHR